MAKRHAAAHGESQEKMHDFTKLALRPQILEAVAAAVAVGTKQPVILDLVDDYTGEQTQAAYYPADREVGEWFLQLLEYTARHQDNGLHYAMTALVENELCQPDAGPMDVESLFRGLYGDKLTKPSDVGQFLNVMGADEDLDDDEPGFVHRTSMATFLYHQVAYTKSDASHSSDSDSSDESSSSGSESSSSSSGSSDDF